MALHQRTELTKLDFLKQYVHNELAKTPLHPGRKSQIDTAVEALPDLDPLTETVQPSQLEPLLLELDQLTASLKVPALLYSSSEREKPGAYIECEHGHQHFMPQSKTEASVREHIRWALYVHFRSISEQLQSVSKATGGHGAVDLKAALRVLGDTHNKIASLEPDDETMGMIEATADQAHTLYKIAKQNNKTINQVRRSAAEEAHRADLAEALIPYPISEFQQILDSIK